MVNNYGVEIFPQNFIFLTENPVCTSSKKSFKRMFSEKMWKTIEIDMCNKMIDIYL